MKKLLSLFVLMVSAIATSFALTVEGGKYYTIKLFSANSSIYLADRQDADNRIAGVGAISDVTYWSFEPTDNADCYYIKNYATGRYMQGYTAQTEQKVLMGDEPAEYHVVSFANENDRFGLAYTGVKNDFANGTIGLNPKGESHEEDCWAQTFNAVAGANHRSFADIEEVTPPLTVKTTKVYTISNRNDNNCYVKDAGTDEIKMGVLDNASLWQFEDAGNGRFYVKNVLTGRYAQNCATSAEETVRMGTEPVAYCIVNCSNKEGKDCFGLTSADQSNTTFTNDCIGWNWRSDNTVQTFAAAAGTNHRSFWKFTELTPTAITGAGYATYKANEDVIVLGAQAYKGAVGSYVKLTEVADIPAGAAVVLKGSMYATVRAKASADMSDNDLQASTGIEADGSQYCLADGPQGVGFYRVEAGTTIAADKAYITAEGANVKSFYGFDNITGICTAPKADEEAAAVYNIRGQRIEKMQKGINIVDGKKVLY